MKRLLIYALFGLIAYGIFMLVQIPATTFMDLLTHHVPELSAREVQGSAIRGTAHGLRLQDAHMESLSWRWRPLSLLTGRIEYRLATSEPHLNLVGFAGMNVARQIRIDDLSGQARLSRVISLLSRPPLLIDGELDLAVDELYLDSVGLPSAIWGTVSLLGAHTTVGRTFELGDFRAEFTTEAQSIVGAVKDEGGPLELNGILTLAPDGRYRFTGQIGVRDENNRDLRQVLGILGRPGVDGRWQMDFTGFLQV